MIAVTEIVQHAIHLAARGQWIRPDPHMGAVQIYESGPLTVLYQTPFSAIEILPDYLPYTVDIWINHKKVFRVEYRDWAELAGKRKHPAPWIARLLAE